MEKYTSAISADQANMDGNVGTILATLKVELISCMKECPMSLKTELEREPSIRDRLLCLRSFLSLLRFWLNKNSDKQF